MKRNCGWTIRFWLIGLVLSLAVPQIGQAQFAPSREYPGQDYYQALQEYQDGDFRSAWREFQSAGKSGIRTTVGRWVDSICYYTMMGECQFQMGDLTGALEQYTHALNLLVAHRHWMLRVDFPALSPDGRGGRRPITWGASGRVTGLARFPFKYPILQGRTDNERVIQQGGVVALPEYHMINAHEIARCSAVAIRRRHQIMGIACPHDPLTTQVLQALSLRPAPPNHWSQAWISVQLGMAYAAAGKGETAIGELNRGVQVAETFDHPLTPVTLLQLGQLSFQQKQFAKAGKYFFEATISGALFEQYDVMEEAFRGGLLTHTVTGQPGLYPPLAASEWAQRESRWLEVSLLVAAAQNSAELNEPAAAVALAERARRRAARSDVLLGAVGARLQYVNALVNFQTGNLKAGNTAFASLLTYQTKSSFRLFEIGLVDRLYTSGVVTGRVGDGLYASALREPGVADWAVDPVETLSVVLTPHLPALEHWFEAALERKEPERAIEIADRIRRHRFYTTLPMGGRLLALRWVLEAPTEALSANAVIQRQDLMDSYPQYAALSKQAAAIQQTLDAGPLVPDDDVARRDQTKLLGELSNVSLAQEIRLREMALRRTPSDFVFPPLLEFKKLQAELPERQLVLSFLITSRGAYAFLFGKSNYATWKLEAPLKVRAQISALLRSMGHLDGNQAVDLEKFADPAWKGIAQEVLKRLTNNTATSIWDRFDELVIVPDGPLWYVPFESLQIVDGAKTVPVISKVRVRYVPTVALALPDAARRAGPVAETAVVVGALYPRTPPEVAERALEDLKVGLPRVTRLTDPLPASSNLFAMLCDRVVVLDDMLDRSNGPYGWSPLQIDRGKAGGTLENWIALPWGAPQQIVMPGFHTSAEDGLKKRTTGDEIFLAVTGLMATGTRTILLSRWRTGGQTSYDLVREFTQELPYSVAADAWQRSVELVRAGELDVEREPRVKAARLDRAPKADHPFFWSGYMLVDTGMQPQPVEPGAVAKAKPAVAK